MKKRLNKEQDVIMGNNMKTFSSSKKKKTQAGTDMPGNESVTVALHCDVSYFQEMLQYKAYIETTKN